MEDLGTQYSGAKVRIHPNHSKDKTAQTVKEATKRFLEKTQFTKTTNKKEVG